MVSKIMSMYQTLVFGIGVAVSIALICLGATEVYNKFALTSPLRPVIVDVEYFDE